MDDGGWGGAADPIGRGGNWLLGFEGESKVEACADVADVDDLGCGGASEGVVVADDAFGGDTCRVNGGVVDGVDREWEEAGPDDAESRDVSSVDGDTGRIVDGDGGPADVFGGIAEVNKRVCVGAKDFDDDGTAERNNPGVADADLEGAMESSVDVDTEGDANFKEHFVAANRIFSRNSCCISSLLRA